ncbi:SdrD B-like domain-containing protein [Aurantimonas sp. HBX-1]|uniref:SdrD B-like domain-containing protein n=1 Tax=Aurantimonas sp. HBX-1 TaxID=2906072 RepID=UPI001F4814B5|nr:SdrD B-like domain-containing protein [Aurantimonas sp. HBX-1]UIJ71783.1 hypothetical protein LXB15_19170 [Aurantimonas sp. HBX-1]
MAAWLPLGSPPAAAGDLYGDVLAAPQDDEPRPLPNQPVELCDKAGGGCESQVTDGQGYYQFDDLESGTYTLKTPGSDGRLLEQDVTVDEGRSQELRILAR